MELYEVVIPIHKDGHDWKAGDPIVPSDLGAFWVDMLSAGAVRPVEERP